LATTRVLIESLVFFSAVSTHSFVSQTRDICTEWAVSPET
jgi:hypothetical protein